MKDWFMTIVFAISLPVVIVISVLLTFPFLVIILSTKGQKPVDYDSSASEG